MIIQNVYTKWAINDINPLNKKKNLKVINFKNFRPISQKANRYCY